MFERREYLGVFWLPNEDHKLPKDEDTLSGTLIFDPVDGIELKLVGVFDKDFHKHRNELDLTIILGSTIDGKVITLVNCRNIKIVIHGLASSIYDIDILFVGKHFHTIEEICFDKMQVEPTNLYEWVLKSGFEPNLIKK